MYEKVCAYIDSKKNAWSPSTVASERSRLRRLMYLVNKPAQEAYDTLSKEQKPYAVKTAFIRLGEFYSYLYPTAATNPFKDFMIENANFFKRAYQPKHVDMTFEQVVEKIAAIKNEAVREKITQLLTSGMRWTESHTIDAAGFVTGKGGKRRKVFAVTVRGASYYEVYTELKKIGITPHTLRKLFATKVGDRVTPQDLCKLMGWSDIKTAYVYLQPKDDERLGALVQEAIAR